MAYAELAGLSPVAGLYALLLPTVAYTLLGSSRQLIVGPEGSIAALTATALVPLAADTPERYGSLAALLALLVRTCFLAASVAPSIPNSLPAVGVGHRSPPLRGQHAGRLVDDHAGDGRLAAGAKRRLSSPATTVVERLGPIAHPCWPVLALPDQGGRDEMWSITRGG
jgi:hypothetical protein